MQYFVSLLFLYLSITQTCLCNILQFFTAVKMISFLNFAQNIDRGYTLDEYPQSMFQAKIKKCISHKPQFYYLKMGCKGVLIARTC